MSTSLSGPVSYACQTRLPSFELEYSRSTVFFIWAGFEEMDEVSGSGSSELQDDGSLEIALAYRFCAEAILKAAQAPSSTAC